jgi:glycosyltransferase involved in cell wall biosynthesis
VQAKIVAGAPRQLRGRRTGSVRLEDLAIAPISALIPVFNGAKTVRAAIASIQRQSVTDIEIVVVDDGSTDETPLILKDIAADDRRVLVLTKANSGIVDALNLGLAVCTGEYVARHDADDIAYSHRFATQLRYLQDNDDCVAVSNAARHVDGEGNPTGFVATYPSSCDCNPLWLPSEEPYLLHPFLMARRAAIVAVSGYRNVFNAQDTDLFWRLRELGRLHNLSAVLGEYRAHVDSISAKSIENGRISALNAQLAAISAVRRSAGIPDIEFPADLLARYKAGRTIGGMAKIWKRSLTRDELDYLRLASLAKLLELTTHRPYELELADCLEMRQALRSPPSFMTRKNGKWLDRLIANAGGRLLLKGQLDKAWALLPPQLYHAAAIRFLFRKFASPALRRMIKRRLGRKIAPSDY